jgi:glucokinase
MIGGIMVVIGINLGGTNVSMGRIEDNRLEKVVSGKINNQEDKFKILDFIFNLVNEVFTKDTIGIGFGVPSVVDVERGIAYDVPNIPSWKRVHLKELMEKWFKVPVFLNNRANCFALGEKHFGKSKRYPNSVGLIIDSGVGAGLIINDKLFSGRHCMAGEFGKIPYQENNFEYYCSEKYFMNLHGEPGSILYKRGLEGDKRATKVFDEYGVHLGNAIKTILYSVDPDIIVLGGSVSKYFDLFSDSMEATIKDLVFPQSLKDLKIEVSDIEQISILGAAALYLDATS